MGNWFNDVFLPSLFEQVGIGSKWLSWKQTAVCIDNMDRCVGGYETVWQDRVVSLHVSDWTGRGKITFSQSEDEFQTGLLQYRAQMKYWMQYRLEEKLQHDREGFLEELQRVRDDMEDCKSLILLGTAENDWEVVEGSFLAYQDYREQLQIMQQMLAKENQFAQ